MGIIKMVITGCIGSLVGNVLRNSAGAPIGWLARAGQKIGIMAISWYVTDKVYDHVEKTVVKPVVQTAEKIKEIYQEKAEA